MKVEKVNNPTGVYDIESAIHFVYSHRNVMAQSSRRYFEYRGKDFFVVKEITKFENEVCYWYWKLYKDHYIIFKFDHKPTRKEREKIWELITK